MLNLPTLALLMSGLLLSCLVAPMAGQSCTSCGPECVSACGSRRYRTCCFNYLRKRRSPAAPGMPSSELADLGPGGPDGLPGLPGLPEDVRLQLVLVPNDREGEGQDQYPSVSLLHRLLDAQSGETAEGNAGNVEVTNAPVVVPAAPAAPAAAASPATLQRHRLGGGLGAASKDWLSDLRRRVGLVYNV